MANRDACKGGHRYVAGSYSWRASGTRRCLVCERLGREARKARLQLRASLDRLQDPQYVMRVIRQCQEQGLIPQDKS